MIVKAIRRLSRIPLDVHLMIEDPLRYLQPFVDAGSDWITVHAECCSLLGEAIEAVRTAGVKAGVSLNPLTPFSGLERELLSADLVLMMTVHPGFGGQRFMDSVLPKIAQFRKLRDDKHQTTPVIAVDGGIDEKTAPMAVRAGAEILVAGSAIFNAPDPARAIGALRAAGEGV
jgi:ribulose-phosphate 3-epimerase